MTQKFRNLADTKPLLPQFTVPQRLKGEIPSQFTAKIRRIYGKGIDAEYLLQRVRQLALSLEVTPSTWTSEPL